MRYALKIHRNSCLLLKFIFSKTNGKLYKDYFTYYSRFFHWSIASNIFGISHSMFKSLAMLITASIALWVDLADFIVYRSTQPTLLCVNSSKHSETASIARCKQFRAPSASPRLMNRSAIYFSFMQYLTSFFVAARAFCCIVNKWNETVRHSFGCRCCPFSYLINAASIVALPRLKVK